MTIKHGLWMFLALALAACAVPERSDRWALDAEQSALRFVTVKNSSVAETHRFKRISGLIEGRQASVSVALNSVDTGIPIRDERMQAMLFEVTRFAELTATVALPEAYADIASGQQQVQEIAIELSLHGVRKTLAAEVAVSKSSDGALLVASHAPLVVTAQDFGLDAGVDKLREVAGLQHISYAVPVSFNLRFTR